MSNIQDRNDRLLLSIPTYELESQRTVADTPTTPNPWTKYNTIKTLDKDISPSIYSDDGVELDPFVPFPIVEGEEEEKHILTARALIIGCTLGALINTSNVYLGLKTGWTFSAGLFGAIFGFAICKFFSRIFSENFPIFGGKFGPKENSIIQTAATASGGLSNIFVAAIPALYQYGLLGKSPQEDFGRLLAFTAVTSYYGLFFATPLRKFFIIQTSREQNLIFPTATATAYTIRSMHNIGGSDSAMRRVKYLVVAFVCSIALRVASQYAPGVLWDWHIFTWLYQWSGHQTTLFLKVESWGWYIEWTPAFIGIGMLVGLNSAFSFFAGSVMSWAIIGPVLVHYGVAVGVSVMKLGQPGYEQWKDWTSYYDINRADVGHPSPRYWLLWPGVVAMIFSAFTEMAIQYRLIWFALKSGLKSLMSSVNYILICFGTGSTWLEKRSRITIADQWIEDPAPKSQHINSWMITVLTLLTVVFTCIILTLQFQMSLGMSLLSIVLGFFFAFLAVQAAGVTDVVPLTTCSKATQMILGGVGHATGLMNHDAALRTNLLGGAVAVGAASQATELVSDFRVGFLLRTPPNLQWAAQAIGSFVAIFLSVGTFTLFTIGYPCIIDMTQSEQCPFKYPSVTAWKAVSEAVTGSTLPIPATSGYFSIAFGLFAIVSVLFRHYVLINDRARWRPWVPNFMAIGLAFVLPTTIYSTAMVMGSMIAFVWGRCYPRSFQALCFSLAAGMIAGEGIGGVVNAVLVILKISGQEGRGSSMGCPGDAVCNW